jgi:hypothetical protein
MHTNAAVTQANPCSCGCAEPHEVARRKTANGVTVVLWSDGGVSGVMGMHVWGEAARSSERHAAYMRGGWLLMEEVGLYESKDLRRLVKTARRAVEQKREAPLAYLRRVMAGRPFRVREPSARAIDNEVVTMTAYDEETGRILWHRSVSGQPPIPLNP